MLHASCSKLSQLSNNEKIENLSTIDKVTICNAMSPFLDHPVFTFPYKIGQLGCVVWQPIQDKQTQYKSSIMGLPLHD